MITGRRLLLPVVMVFAGLLVAPEVNCQQKDSIYCAKLAGSTTAIIPLKEGYKVFSQTWGKGKTTILLLHGGPGNTHEYFEIFKTQLPPEEYQIIVYDQLGSYYSDQPSDTSLWNINRLVGEVEQVRAFYHLQGFYLLGHSFGGLLAMEYAVRFPGRLQGLIISNRSYSQDSLNQYVQHLRQKLARKEQLTNARHQASPALTDSIEKVKLTAAFRRNHIVRLDTLPEPMARNALHLTKKYQSYYHFREHWNFIDSLPLIRVPVLIIGGKFDQVSERDLALMSSKIQCSTVYICPNGSHFPFWDDTKNYFNALRHFITTSNAALKRGQ